MRSGARVSTAEAPSRAENSDEIDVCAVCGFIYVVAAFARDERLHGALHREVRRRNAVCEKHERLRDVEPAGHPYEAIGTRHRGMKRLRPRDGLGVHVWSGRRQLIGSDTESRQTAAEKLYQRKVALREKRHESKRRQARDDDLPRATPERNVVKDRFADCRLDRLRSVCDADRASIETGEECEACLDLRRGRPGVKCVRRPARIEDSYRRVPLGQTNKRGFWAAKSGGCGTRAGIRWRAARRSGGQLLRSHPRDRLCRGCQPAASRRATRLWL